MAGVATCTIIGTSTADLYIKSTARLFGGDSNRSGLSEMVIGSLTLGRFICVSTGTSQLWKQQCENGKEDTMYFAGIDISKFKHDCVVIDEIGDTILPSQSFSNDCEGFSLLREKLRSLADEVERPPATTDRI